MGLADVLTNDHHFTQGVYHSDPLTTMFKWGWADARSIDEDVRVLSL
jgi:hypothetical protein